MHTHIHARNAFHFAFLQVLAILVREGTNVKTQQTTVSESVQTKFTLQMQQVNNLISGETNNRSECNNISATLQKVEVSVYKCALVEKKSVSDIIGL